jgi:hypothetical protein
MATEAQTGTSRAYTPAELLVMAHENGDGAVVIGRYARRDEPAARRRTQHMHC